MYIFLSLLLVIGALFIYVPASIFKKIFTKNSNIPNHPPGTFGWPIIGESLDFSSAMQKGSPEKFVNDRMKKYSPTQVYKTSMLGEKVAVLSGPLGNKLLFSNQDKLVVSWWPRAVEKIIFSGRSSTSSLKGRRGNIVQFLKPDALRTYVTTIQYIVEDHLEQEWVSKNEVNVYPLAKKLTFSLGCRCLIGLEDSEKIAKLAYLFHDVIAGVYSIPINFPGTAFNRSLKAAESIKNEIVPIIKQMRSTQSVSGETNHGKQYLFSHLILETDDNGEFLPELDIADEILGVIVASYDTTSSLITSILYYLADHPLIYARVLKEQTEILNSKQPKSSLTMEDIHKMKYSRNVVDEVLRIAGPSPGYFREVKTEFTFGGYNIPKGWKIFLSPQSTHSNEEYFPNPKKFDPSRFEGNGPAPYTYVPFGGGPRMCPGRDFAHVQVLIVMHCLVTKFGWEKLFPEEKMTYKPVAVPEKCLPIRLFPHGN